MKTKAEAAGLVLYQWIDIINKGREVENPTISEP
jgi:hypothetical protein